MSLRNRYWNEARVNSNNDKRGKIQMKEETLILLGTGNATVTRCFNTCFAIKRGEEYFLVDTGGGN